MMLATLVGVLLLVIIVNSAGLFYKQSSKLSEGLNINDALFKVRQTVKESSAVITSYTDGTTTYTSSGTQLILKIPSVDLSGSIIANTFDYFIFFKDQDKLRFKTFPDSKSTKKAQDQIFSTSVDSLKFQYFSSANPPVEVTPATATKVRITLSLKQKSGASFETNTATSEANLRND